MVAIPIWLIGKHVSAITITPQDIASDGTLSNNSVGAKSLVGMLDQIEMNQENDLENIQALDIRRNNNVIVGTGTSFTLTQILRQNDVAGTPTNILAAVSNGMTGLSGGADIHLINITRGGRSFAFYGIARSYNETINRGKSTCRLVVDMVDPGSANPAYT